MFELGACAHLAEQRQRQHARGRGGRGAAARRRGGLGGSGATDQWERDEQRRDQSREVATRQHEFLDSYAKRGIASARKRTRDADGVDGVIETGLLVNDDAV